MHILVTGATGLIGSALVGHLEGNGHRVLRLVRKSPVGDNEIRWDPSTGTLDKVSMEGLDAVVHLAGENIAAGRWTQERRHRIRESRIQGTRLLAQSLSHLFDPPKVLVSVSAVGYYGDRGEELLVEDSPAGSGFLPDLCQAWEEATSPAAVRDIRVVIPRLGMVLSARGGALGRMLPLFRRGWGGRLGSGAQYMSWIALDDLVRIIEHAIQTETLRGPVNAVAPHSITNLEFTEILSRVLDRPARLAVPAFAMRLALGQMADEVLLASARVTPARLQRSDFRYLYPDPESALRHILQAPPISS